MAEAKTKIVIETGEAAKSMRTLKQEFKEAQKELDGMAVGTKEYRDQLKKLADVKDEMDDLNKAITAFDPGKKLGALVGVGRGIAAGFEAATAASALFGAETENVEKAILKVQSAMALSNAIQEVGELGKQFQLLGQVLKSMIGSTGIGLLVVAIAAIAANWDRIKEAVSGVSKEQEEQLANANEAVKLGKERLDNLSTEEKKWKLMGLTQEQIIAKKQEEYAIQKGLLKNQIEAQLNIALAQEKAAERNKEILTGILKFTTAPLQAIISGIDYIAEKVSGKKLIDVDLADKMANVIFDPKEAKERTEKLKEEFINSNKAIINAELDLQLELKGIRDAAAKKKADENAKEVDEFKKRQEERKKILSEAENQQADAGDLAIAKWKAQKDVEYQLAKEAQEAQTALAKLHAEQRTAIREAEFQTASSIVSGFGSLAEILGAQGETAVKIQKGTALAQIAIDTAKAISALVAASQSNPLNGPTFGAAGVAQFAAGIAQILANIAKAKQILSAGAGGGVGGGTPNVSGGGGVRPPSLGQTVGSTTTNLDDLNKGGRQAQPVMKAIVVETDITSSQKRVNKIIDKTKH